MSFFPAEAYKVLHQLFDIVEIAGEEKSKYTEQFEERLTRRFVDAVYKKLPEEERKKTVEMANAAKMDEEKQVLQQQFEKWLTKEELKNLFQKVADQEFNDLLRFVYKNVATAEQKRKLETVFKPEVLQ